MESFVVSDSNKSSGFVYSSDPIFVNQEDFEKTVSESPYFHLLTPWDLRVRGHTGDNESYKIKYMKSRAEITGDQKMELESLVKVIDQEMELGSKSVLGRLPWKFVIFDGVEGGLCHTIGDIIMFPSDFFEYSRDRKIRLLIHEKVHVYQRFDPSWGENIIKAWGMVMMGQSGDGSLGWMEDIRRHNPDLDLFDYGFLGSGERLVELYTDDNSLMDSATFSVRDGNSEPKLIRHASDIGMPSYIGQIEHPYEMMACMIPVLVLGHGEGGDKERIISDAFWIKN